MPYQDENAAMPSVSVIIPAYNAEKYLPDAIRSVQSQAHSNLEIIVVNDGSTDGTRQIVQSFQGVIYIHQANQGPAVARNAGLRCAKGELITFLDADDMWHEQNLEQQIAALESNPTIDLTIGLTQLINPDGVPLGDPMCLFSLGSTLFKARVFQQIGLFDETLRFGEDTDLFMRIRESGTLKIKLLTTTAQYCRRHKTNMTRNETAKNQSLLHGLRRSLNRRRQVTSGAANSLPELEFPAIIQAQIDEFNDDTDTPR
jgi:glycosyltransferase involved in cell wall biosynthesis